MKKYGDREGEFDVGEYRALLTEMTEMTEGGIINESTRMGFACGELSIHPKRREILRLFDRFPCTIFSSCVVFDEAIAGHAGYGKTTLNCSVDAGTRETYAKVKGADVFEKVCGNLEQYAGRGAKLLLKYIFLKGINDNEADIDGFVRLVEKLRPGSVMISWDYYDAARPDNHMIGMMGRMFSAIRNLGVHVGVNNNSTFKKDEMVRISDVETAV
jgi:hypothetical protein